MQHPLVSGPIASATKEKQLNDLMQAAEITLFGSDVERLNEAGE